MDALRRLFPACVTEAQGQDGQRRPAVDFDLLRQELSEQLVDGPAERYQLTWPGKRQSMLAAHQPCAQTLRPCPADSLRFETTKNLFIEGDNLDALKLLQETYLARVKAIYIDPPYNTGKDFIYSDKFAMSKKEWEAQTGERAERGRLIANPDSGGRYHSNWLSMMYPRLKLARNLLARNGVMFISIDDNEQHNLRKLMDEIFGAINFVAQIVWRKKAGGGQDSKHLAEEHEYILCYAREIDEFQINFRTAKVVEKDFPKIKNGRKCKFLKLEKWGPGALRTDRPTMYYAIKDPDGNDFYPQAPNGEEGRWRTRPTVLDANHIHWEKRSGRWTPYEVIYFDESDAEKIVKDRTIFYDLATTTHAAKEQQSLFGAKMIDTPKPVRLVEHLLRLSTSPTGSTHLPGQSSDASDREGDIVMDFFAGSGTTGHAAMKLNAEDGGNRRFILVQLPEKCGEKTEAFKAGFKTIADIAKERLRRAANMLAQQSGKSEPERDTGFRVLKIGDSNFQDCRRLPHECQQEDLIQLADNLRPNRQPLDLLFETMLDLGIDLTLPIHTQTIHNQQVFFLADNQVIACFEEGLTEEFAQALTPYKPRRLVFRDGGFASDAVRINIGQLFQQISPSTRLTII